ncbi:hypothetical protein BV20DRAFT_1102819 [Pilatotrama ljubarskyi]|nr:hypothetical protein BV20DRAFT_1102819 [Pilatotrama ljubarskyi]
MKNVILRGDWPGIACFKHLVVFGASYCDVGYNSKAPHPTPEKPLGVEFPGNTWCGHPDENSKSFIFEPNWVGHLVELVRQRHSSTLLVYDYALGGDRVEGVKRQIHHDFLPHLAPKPDWAPWTSADTLFMTWIGINDCGWNADCSDPVSATEHSIRELFTLYEEVYETGARNFCFIDVPPTYDFPLGGQPPSEKLKDTVLAWNATLRQAAERFHAEHPDATVLVWSAWRLSTDLLADPESFGFGQEEAAKEEGQLFEDGLHPTSALHRVIAQELLAFLSSIDGSPSSEASISQE